MQETRYKSEKSRVAVKKAEKALEQGFAEVKTSSQAADVSTRSKMPRATLRKRISHPVKALQIQSNKLQPLTTPQPPRVQKSALPRC